jgi:putative transposase
MASRRGRGQDWRAESLVLWRAVDQAGVVLDVLVPRLREKQAAKRLLRKLLKKHMQPPRVLITDKLASCGGGRGSSCPGLSIASTRA